MPLLIRCVRHLHAWARQTTLQVLNGTSRRETSTFLIIEAPATRFYMHWVYLATSTSGTWVITNFFIPHSTSWIYQHITCDISPKCGSGEATTLRASFIHKTSVLCACVNILLARNQEIIHYTVLHQRTLYSNCNFSTSSLRHQYVINHTQYRSIRLYVLNPRTLLRNTVGLSWAQEPV